MLFLRMDVLRTLGNVIAVGGGLGILIGRGRILGSLSWWRANVAIQYNDIQTVDG